MKTIIIILSIISFSVSAENRLIIPLATTHIGSNTYIDNSNVEHDYNEQNHGLGFEKTHSGYAFGVVYLANNSYGNKSLYIYGAKEIKLNKDWTFSYGAALASGYDLISDTGIIASPVFAIQYHDIRFVTTYPGSALTHPDDQPAADSVNAQIVFSF